MKYDIFDSLERRAKPENGPNPERSICDVHREAFLIARDRSDKRSMALIAEAFDMGKRMSDKLLAFNGAGFAARGRKTAC